MRLQTVADQAETEAVVEEDQLESLVVVMWLMRPVGAVLGLDLKQVEALMMAEAEQYLESCSVGSELNEACEGLSEILHEISGDFYLDDEAQLAT